MPWTPPLQQAEQSLQTCAGITGPFLICQKWLLQLVWLHGMLCDSILHLREECTAEWSDSACIGKVTITGRAQHLDLIALNSLMSGYAWGRAAGFVQCPKLTCWTGQWAETYLRTLKMMQWPRWTVVGQDGQSGAPPCLENFSAWLKFPQAYHTRFLLFFHSATNAYNFYRI